MIEWINIISTLLALIVSFVVPFCVLRKEYENNVRFRLFDKRVKFLEKAVFISSLNNKLTEKYKYAKAMEYYNILPNEFFLQIYTKDYLDYQQICATWKNETKDICDFLYREKVECEELQGRCEYLFPETDSLRLKELFASYINFVTSLSEACRIRESSCKNYSDVSEEQKTQAWENYKKSVVIPFNELIKKSDELLNKINKTNIDKITKSYYLFPEPAHKHCLTHKK